MFVETPAKLFGAAAITLAAFGIGPMMALVFDGAPPVDEVFVTESYAVQMVLEAPPMEIAEPEAEPAEEVVEPVAALDDAGAAQPVFDEGIDAPTPRVGRPPPDEDPVVAAVEEEKAKPSRRKACDAEDNPAIQRVALGRFDVARDLVTHYTKHLGELNRLGWSAKHEGPDGRSDGMRIGGVKCGSDLYLAGIRSGDVVHRVNGRDVRSIPQALLVYGAVRKDEIIRVELTRRGKLHTFTYRLS